MRLHLPVSRGEWGHSNFYFILLFYIEGMLFIPCDSLGNDRASVRPQISPLPFKTFDALQPGNSL